MIDKIEIEKAKEVFDKVFPKIEEVVWELNKLEDEKQRAMIFAGFVEMTSFEAKLPTELKIATLEIIKTKIINRVLSQAEKMNEQLFGNNFDYCG